MGNYSDIQQLFRWYSKIRSTNICVHILKHLCTYSETFVFTYSETFVYNILKSETLNANCRALQREESPHCIETLSLSLQFHFVPPIFFCPTHLYFVPPIFSATPQDALEVIFVTQWVNEWVRERQHWFDWCDSCEWGYLLETWPMWLWCVRIPTRLGWWRR